MAVDGRGLQAAGGRDRLAPPGIGGDDRRPADAGEPGDRAEDPIEAPALQRDVVDVGDQARAGRGVNRHERLTGLPGHVVQDGRKADQLCKNAAELSQVSPGDSLASTRRFDNRLCSPLREMRDFLSIYFMTVFLRQQSEKSRRTLRVKVERPTY